MPPDDRAKGKQPLTPPQRAISKRVLSIAVPVTVITVLVVGGGIAINGFLAWEFFCPPDYSIHDRPGVTAAESHALMSKMTSIYGSVGSGQLKVSSIGQLTPPRPIAVISIANNVATVRVAREYDPGGGEYASAWADVFQKAHPDIRFKCARINFVWANGSSSAQCCNIPL